MFFFSSSENDCTEHTVGVDLSHIIHFCLEGYLPQFIDR